MSRFTTMYSFQGGRFGGSGLMLVVYVSCVNTMSRSRHHSSHVVHLACASALEIP